MKKFTLILLLLFASNTVLFSNSVNAETAKTVAQNFMSKNGRQTSTSRTALNVIVEKFEGQNSIYVINFPLARTSTSVPMKQSKEM